MSLWGEWRHVVKLDPDRPISKETLAEIGQTGTDAILLGGTQGITREKTQRLFEKVRETVPKLPVWQEISVKGAILQGVDGYGVPVVLNAGGTEWLIGSHARAIETYGNWIPWQQIVVEGYLILNGNAAAAKLTQANTDLSPVEAASYAVAAERLFGMDTIYVEYSGCYGDESIVKEIRRSTHAHLVYGGGIDTYDKAAAMGEWCDTIVVGNAIYEKGMDALYETVRAVK